MNKWWMALLIALCTAPAAIGQVKYTVDPAAQTAVPDGVADEIKAKLAGTMYKVHSPERTACEIWLVKQMPVKAAGELPQAVNYALEEGALVGLVRLPQKGEDFRGQEIPSGVYTLRYGRQPQDGNHVGSWESLDFLLMLPVSVDKSAGPITDNTQLTTESGKSASSSHPAVLPLMKPSEEKAPLMHHRTEHDWWSVLLAGEDMEGHKVAVEPIVVGRIAE